MVSEHDEETKKHNKTDCKANAQKNKTFAQFSSVIDTSCTKLHELFCCQKVAHSVIFYVFIFLLLLALVYIFRKLVSLPNSNGRYHGRKHNTSTSTTGSRYSNDTSLSKGFPTKWPKLNKLLKDFPQAVPISDDLSSARETKTHIYRPQGSGWQVHEYSSNNKNINSGENSEDAGYKYKPKNPTINSYSSSYNNNFLNQKNNGEHTSNNLHAANWITPNYVGSNEYDNRPSESSGRSFPSGSDTQYDWSSQENSGFTQPDSSWKNSWGSASWDFNSNLRSWPYSGSSGSGVRKVNQKSQGARSRDQSFPGPASYAKKYASSSWAKWSQPGSGFGWFKATDNDKENFYKSRTTPNWNNYNYDSASGKWNFNKQNTNDYFNYQSGENHGTSNSYHVDNVNNWNPYDKYWNQTQGWGDFDAANSNTVLGTNTRGGHDMSNRMLTNNGIESFQETGSNSALPDDNVEERIHRWPLEDDHDDQVPEHLSSTFRSHKRKSSKGSRKKNKKIRHKIRIAHQMIRKKKKYNYVKKSYIPHSTKVKLPRRITSKQIPRKLSREKKRLSKMRHSKPRKYSTITISNEKRRTSNKQSHFVGKWKRKVHHVKHCKNLQSFESNGKVKLDKKYLHKQRMYKYTVLSCRYIIIRKKRKIHRRHLDDGDVDDLDEDNDDEDEIPQKRKQICRKFWFITNGKILLDKETKKRGLSSYKILLCRKRDEPQSNRENNGSKDRIGKQTTHRTHNKAKNYLTDNTYTEDEDNDSDFQTTHKMQNSRKNNHDNDADDSGHFEGGTPSDIDDDIDIDTDSKQVSSSKQIVDNDDEGMNEKKQQSSDENDNDFYAKSRAEKLHSQRKKETTRNHNKRMKISRPDKTKHIHNEDDLNGVDIDDIDDVDDNSGYPEGRTERQRPIDDVDTDNDDNLDSNRLGGDIVDDVDIMDTDLKTTSRPKPTISSRLQKTRKAKNRHRLTKHKSSRTKQGSDKKSNLYERLLRELTKDKDTNDKSNDPKRLLMTILKKKIDSVRVPKHATTKISHTNSPDLGESKRKDKVQTDNKIRPVLKNMLIHSLGLNSLSQMIKTKQPRKRLQTTTKPETSKLMKDLLKEFLPGDLKLPIWPGEPTGSTTQKPTVAPTSPDEQMKTQFAKLLKKFGIQTNVSGNALTGGSTSTTSQKNLANDIGNEMKMHNPTSTGSVVMSNKPSLPTSDLSPQPSLPPSKLLRPPLRLAPLAEPPPQQQKQPTQSQLITTPPSLPTQQKISTSSTNLPYLSHEPEQKQPNIQRSFIPTVKPQKTVQISQEESFPQSQQQVANPRYSYSSYLSNNNNPYVSPQTQRTINVLCFGDSLTSGFYNHGRGKHPYSIKLNQLLNPQGSHRYHIETRGVVGEMAHGSMTKRLPKVLNEGTHYDWVLILGGTNDVAHVKNFGDDQDFTRQLIGVWSPKIVKDIEKLHETARSYGSRTVLMTIPETAYELWPDFVSIRNMRLSVNAALRKYATEVRDTTVLCDLAYKLPRSTLSHEMEKLYWNDHIHLNPVGYNKMAEVIEQCIQPYLS